MMSLTHAYPLIWAGHHMECQHVYLRFPKKIEETCRIYIRHTFQLGGGDSKGSPQHIPGNTGNEETLQKKYVVAHNEQRSWSKSFNHMKHVYTNSRLSRDVKLILLPQYFVKFQAVFSNSISGQMSVTSYKKKEKSWREKAGGQENGPSWTEEREHQRTRSWIMECVVNLWGKMALNFCSVHD